MCKMIINYKAKKIGVKVRNKIIPVMKHDSCNNFKIQISQHRENYMFFNIEDDV